MITIIAALFIVALSATAILSKQNRVMVAALIALAIALAAVWALTMLMLGDLAAHYDITSWPSPLALAFYIFVGYAIVVSISVLRKTS